ncbi:hypothetical protein FRC06_001686, partial [Ceratobasidium sp. 370]
MAARAGRPSQLKPIPARVSSVLAYQAESTAGLTPRTPFSSRPAEVFVDDDDDDEEDSLEVKVHPSPSAPITPIPRRKSTKPRPNKDSSASGSRWRVVTWSAVSALIIIVLLSLYNVDPRHVFLPQARSDTLTEWIDIVSQDANAVATTDLVHPTRTAEPLHLTEAASSHNDVVATFKLAKSSSSPLALISMSYLLSSASSESETEDFSCHDLRDELAAVHARIRELEDRNDRARRRIAELEQEKHADARRTPHQNAVETCAWHAHNGQDSTRPSHMAQPGALKCGCTLQEALFEESLARYGVGSIHAEAVMM